MALGGLVLGSLILYLKGMRRMMFQLSGFYCRFLSSPFIIRVPFFLIVSFKKGTQKQKGRKGTTQEPRQALLWTRAEVFYALLRDM